MLLDFASFGGVAQKQPNIGRKMAVSQARRRFEKKSKHMGIGSVPRGLFPTIYEQLLKNCEKKTLKSNF